MSEHAKSNTKFWAGILTIVFATYFVDIANLSGLKSDVNNLKDDVRSDLAELKSDVRGFGAVVNEIKVETTAKDAVQDQQIKTLQGQVRRLEEGGD